MGSERASYRLGEYTKNHCRGLSGLVPQVADENCIGTVFYTCVWRVSISVHGTGFTRVRGQALMPVS